MAWVRNNAAWLYGIVAVCRCPDHAAGLTVPPPSAVTVYCVVMRETHVRSMDIVHPGCRFFDVDKNVARWNELTVRLPCSGYNKQCYTKKLAVLIENLLTTGHDYFYYVESDTVPCVPMDVVSELASRYMHKIDLLTTGIGASGWIFTRRWAVAYLRELRACTKWCYCPDCIAALMTLPRATTRVVLAQHVSNADIKSGLSKNDKHLPRCMETRVDFGMNGFDFFDRDACAHNDVSPCKVKNWGILSGH
jgi:hypothetical protein